MGTRNLTTVVFGGATRVAQYGQWDGYPSGQGATILDFVRNKMNAKFFSNLLKTEFIADENFDSRRGKMSVEKFIKKYPQSYRDMGAKILEYIQTTPEKKIELLDNTRFASNALFCEWAYVLDLDKNVLEVHRGTNDKPKKKNARFKNLTLLKSYDLNKLPQKRDFIRELDKLKGNLYDTR